MKKLIIILVIVVAIAAGAVYYFKQNISSAVLSGVYFNKNSDKNMITLAKGETETVNGLTITNKEIYPLTAIETSGVEQPPRDMVYFELSSASHATDRLDISVSDNPEVATRGWNGYNITVVSADSKTGSVTVSVAAQ